MTDTLFDELKLYVEFSAGDEAALRALHPIAAPRFPEAVDRFYDRILAHEGTRKVLRDGESQIGQLRITLLAWLDRLLSGPWDDNYYEARCRIGRVHVRIGLPEHYMFGAMNVLRCDLDRYAADHYVERPVELAAARDALSKILDLELAIMLYTYREDLLARQVQIERMSVFGQLAASIGHDLRNPLAVIGSSVYLLREQGKDEKVKKQLDRIAKQVGVANGIITSLLDIIRDKPLAREMLELARVVADVADSVSRPEGVKLEIVGLSELPSVEADPGQLGQVFANLLQNAVHAASPQGEVRVSGLLTKGGIAVSVEDSGPGVDEAVVRRLFEPLVTTKSKGIGLGLALVKRIVERHGGSVDYERRAEGGARFTVRLPQ